MIRNDTGHHDVALHRSAPARARSPHDAPLFRRTRARRRPTATAAHGGAPRSKAAPARPAALRRPHQHAGRHDERAAGDGGGRGRLARAAAARRHGGGHRLEVAQDRGVLARGCGSGPRLHARRGGRAGDAHDDRGQQVVARQVVARAGELPDGERRTMSGVEHHLRERDRRCSAPSRVRYLVMSWKPAYEQPASTPAATPTAERWAARPPAPAAG